MPMIHKSISALHGVSNARTAVRRFVSCTKKIESWMSCNRLKMNAKKTQVIWIGSRQQLAKVDIEELQLLSANVNFFNHGVQSRSSFRQSADHAGSRDSNLPLMFFQLRQLRAIKSSLMTDAAKTLAQAFVGGRLEYCNSLLYGVTVSARTYCDVCSVQNAAARFITGARKYDHISPVLRDLHWLPLRQRIIIKIATLMHQCLNA